VEEVALLRFSQSLLAIVLAPRMEVVEGPMFSLLFCLPFCTLEGRGQPGGGTSHHRMIERGLEGMREED
jgi:hypothetical protein